MQRVLLINQGNTDNLGDKAINLSFRSLLEKYDFTVDFAGFAQTDEQFIDKIDKKKSYKLKSFVKKRLPNFLIWFLKYRKKIKKELNSLEDQNYDLVIIGGGQLIKSKNVFAYCFLTWITLLRRKGFPIFVVGVGADTQFSFVEKIIYQKCLAQINNIYVRDKESQATLNRIFNINAQYIPDIVLNQRRTTPDSNTFIKEEKLVAMIYDYDALQKNFENDFKTKKEYFYFWKNLIEANCQPGLTITLAYTTIGDKKTTEEFYHYIINNSEMKVSLSNTDRLSELEKLLKTTNILISGRMHGMILGLNHNCIIVPYIVSPKVKAFKEEWLDSDINYKSILEKQDKVIKQILNVNR